MELKLVQVDDDEFKLCNDNNEKIVSFDLEINQDTALISYDTKERFRNQGYASKGLILLRDTLFSNKSILFLELINLSGDYSRKVAENALFFSPSNNINYYVCLNPLAEQIINDRLSSLDISSIEYERDQKILEKVKNLRYSENKAKQKLQDKLDELLKIRELEDLEGDYIKYVESEISHLEKILTVSQEIEKKRK